MRKQEITEVETITKINYDEMQDYFEYLLWHDGIENYEVIECINNQIASYKVFCLSLEIDNNIVCFTDINQIILNRKSVLTMFFKDQCNCYVINDNEDIYIKLMFGKSKYIQIRKS